METMMKRGAGLQPILVNTDGFPLETDTVCSMWRYAAEHHPNAKKLEVRIRNSNKLERVPKPHIKFNSNMQVIDRVKMIQDYLISLQYNFTGMQFFHVNKHRPLSRLMDVAKEIIVESLPIKCLEAVILSIYLTGFQRDLQRFTIRFKSSFNGLVHRHVVLGLSHKSSYGAIGLSRRSALGSKALIHDSLYDLVMFYKAAYEQYFHDLKCIRLGAVLPNDNYTCTTINWSHTHIDIRRLKPEQVKSLCEQYSRIIKTTTNGTK